MRCLTRSYYLGSGCVRALSTGFGTATTSSTASCVFSSPADVRNCESKITPFVRRASILKNRFRGKSQYEFARNEARGFLELEVPKTNINTWLEQTGNAIALSQLLCFFELQPDITLVSLLLNKLLRTAEDTKANPFARLEATLALMTMRPEENYERTFATVEAVLNMHHNNIDKNGPAKMSQQRTTWYLLDLCAKVLQRCGKRVPTALNDRLARAVVVLLQTTEERDLASLESSLLRIYAWMVRAEREEARNMLYVIVHGPPYHKAYRFAILMESCARHHQLQFLPIELVRQLAGASLEYTVSANGHDTSIILSTTAQMIRTLQPGINEVTEADVKALYDSFAALLEDYQPRVLRFMDEKDELYWKHAGDVTTIVFAYELGGSLRHRSIFEKYTEYIAREMSKLEPGQLAMAAGILRRTEHLAPPMLTMLSERIELVLGQMKLSEISHISATFASLAVPPKWLHEARAVALRLLRPDATGLTRLNLAVAFPDESNFIAQVDYTQLSGSQLVATLPLVLGNPVLEGPVVSELVSRLSEGKERFSADDARVLLNCSRPVLVNAVNYYLYQRLSEPKWGTDILYCLPLVINKGGPAQNPAKALQAAKEASISPEQFGSLVELLTSLFGESDISINAFVKAGGSDLLTSQGVLLRSVVRYLAAVRSFPGLHPDAGWLELLVDKIASSVSRLKPQELESLLVSLRTIYTNVHRAPALHMVLSDIVANYFGQDVVEPTVEAARLTVLIVYLQDGMALPLLAEQTPLIRSIQQHSNEYPQDVRDVLAAMPLPPTAPQPEAKLGRFTLKAITTTSAPHDLPAPAHLTDRLDPFLCDDVSSLDLVMSGETVTPAPFSAVLRTHLSEDTEKAAEAQKDSPAATQGPFTGTSATVDLAASAVDPQSTPSASAPSPSASFTMSTEGPGQPLEAAAGPGPTSYYAKFFSSSVGQIFRGRGRPENALDEESSETRPSDLPVSHPDESPTQGSDLTPSSPTVPPFSGWGTPPPSPPLVTAEDCWSLAPSNAVVLGRNSPSSPTGEPRATAFTSLFNTPTGETGAQRPESPPPPPARPPRVLGNHVYFDPLAQPRTRPVITKKALVGRLSKPSNLGAPIERGFYAAATQDSCQAVSKAVPEPGQPPTESHTPRSAIPTSLASEMSTRSTPLAWQEAARRVARITRYARTKEKTRGQQSLSEWLSAPAPPPAPAADTTSSTPGRKRKNSGKAAGDATSPRRTPNHGGTETPNLPAAGPRSATQRKPMGGARGRGRGGDGGGAKGKVPQPVTTKPSTRKNPRVSTPRKTVGNKKAPASPATKKTVGNTATKAGSAKKVATKKASPKKDPSGARKNTRGRKK